MLKVVLLEKEYLTSEFIIGAIESACFDIKVIGIARNVKSALSLFHTDFPDLVLFDIDLLNKRSFDLLKNLGKYNFKIIFITSSDKYAIQAIKFNPVDYLLKPLNEDELILAIEKARVLIKKDLKINQISYQETNFHKQWESEKIVLKTQENVFLIDIKDIVRCESGGSYTHFYLKNGKKITTSKSLKEYDLQLQYQGFLRTHQSHLVNINYLDRFNKRDGGHLIMKDGSSVPISIRKKESFLNLIEEI